MSEYGLKHHIGIRPHVKTHKSKRFAVMQLEAGAMGLTVAKVGEAEVMAEICGDILMAYPPVDAVRCERLAKLAGSITLRVGIDSSLAAKQLSAAAGAAGTTIGILVDYDIGFGRTGVQSVRDAVSLAEKVSKLPGLRLDGIMLYPGHITGSKKKQVKELRDAQGTCDELIRKWRKKGLCSDIVSGGSTPTAYYSDAMPVLTEIRPGTYIFNDMNIVHGKYGDIEDCAARIEATVVSNAVPGQIVVDAGSKTLTMDGCGPSPNSGFGFLVDYPKARIKKLTEEHGQVDVTRCAKPPALGDRVTIIPNHICPCINLHDQVWLKDGDQIEPLKVDARGRVV
jgi:D-serine deaminase-like pyridoxal phosphate-dependent protein